jgi:hypothetical protein
MQPVFLAITFTLCVVWDLALPEYAMYASWRSLLPGFEWRSWKRFLIGLVEAWGYGWFFALIWVPSDTFYTVRTKTAG